jgi:hypothetical protein
MNRIRTVPGIDVIEGEYTPDSFKPKTDANGMFDPYVLVKFNGDFPAHENGIVGPDKDTQRASFSIYVVAPDDRIARDIRNQIRVVLLTNFAPTDGSSLRATGGYSFVDSDLGYQRYAHNAAFSYLRNLS